MQDEIISAHFLIIAEAIFYLRFNFESTKEVEFIPLQFEHYFTSTSLIIKLSRSPLSSK